MKKSIVSIVLGFGLLFALNPQKASKEDLMKIKGVGEAKAEAIIKYRKTHKLKTVEDLMQVKGIGEVIAQNILKDVLNGEESSKPKTKKKSKKSTPKNSSGKKESNATKAKEKKSELKIVKIPFLISPPYQVPPIIAFPSSILNAT